MKPAWLIVVLAAAVGVILAGCATCKPGGDPGRPQAYTLKVRLGDSLKNSSVVVDVISATPSELERLKTYSVNKYWKPNDPVRAGANKKSYSFVSGDKLEQTLPATDGAWKQWIGSGAQYLVVIADLPGVFDEGKIGSQDPRRQLVPMCKCYWEDGSKEVAVEVQAGGVRVVTPFRPGWSLPAGW